MFDDLESRLYLAVVNATDASVEDAGVGPYEFWGRVGYDSSLVLVLDIPDVVTGVEWVGGPPEDDLEVSFRREKGTVAASATVVCRVVPGTLRRVSPDGWVADFEVM